MSVKTEGKHNGQFILSEANGALSRDVFTIASGQTVEDGRVMKDNGAGKLIVAAGTNTGGVSSEDIKGVLIWPAKSPTTLTADTQAVLICRHAEAKSADVVRHAVSGGGLANADLAVKNKLLSLFIALR